jgi:hypothetical protein
MESKKIINAKKQLKKITILKTVTSTVDGMPITILDIKSKKK